MFENPERRKIITKFRLNLVGNKSYYVNNAQNSCNNCNIDVDHISKHLLLHCTKFKDRRDELFEDISGCHGFSRMNEEAKLSFLLNVGNVENKNTDLFVIAEKIVEFMKFISKSQ